MEKIIIAQHRKNIIHQNGIFLEIFVGNRKVVWGGGRAKYSPLPD
jgi:hypothetical protein